MNIHITYIAWLLLVAAFGLWGAVVYVALSIQTQAQASATDVAQSQYQLDRVAYAQRISALAADTKDERQRLDSLVQSDLVSIVGIIEEAGKNARIKATVSDALPDASQRELPGGALLQVVSFVVQAQGTFSDMIKLAGIFERLPLVSSIESIDLERATGGDPKVSLWHLTTRIRVMTTSISS